MMVSFVSMVLLCLFNVFCFVSSSTKNCWDYESCEDTTISGYDIVNCFGYWSCGYSTISANEKIQCDGMSACKYSDIEDTPYVLGQGMKSLWYADIAGVSQLETEGNAALWYATIDTSDIDSFNGTIVGYDATYDTELYCQSGTRCIVTCDGNSCEYLTIYVYTGASLTVYCLPDCAQCPTTEYSATTEHDNTFDKLKIERNKNKHIALTNDLNNQLNTQDINGPKMDISEGVITTSGVIFIVVIIAFGIIKYGLRNNDDRKYNEIV